MRFYILMCWALTAGAVNLSCTENWEGSVDAVFRYRDTEQSLIVYKVSEESFSREAGLQPGDQIVAIDGKPIESLAFEEIRALFRGPVGTMAKLHVERNGEIIEVEVERRKTKREIPLHNGQ